MKISKKDFKKFWQKFWFVVWKDESFRGWLLSIIFLVILIKCVLIPLVSLTMGLGFWGNPLVIVESCSMYHENGVFSNFEGWWERHEFKYFAEGISKETFSNFNFKNGFNKGDILLVSRVNPEKIKVGDVIIFESDGGNPIIHRVMSVKFSDEKYIFSTMGDNNNGQLQTEKSIDEDRVVGRPSAILLPYAGWIKLIFFENLKPNSERGFCSEN